MEPWWMKNCPRKKLLKGAVLMIALAFAAYWLQRLLGVNPQWSVKLAFKWCNSPDHVHVSTTPIFALTRDCGTAIGLALSIPSIPPQRKVRKFAICRQKYHSQYIRQIEFSIFMFFRDFSDQVEVRNGNCIRLARVVRDSRAVDLSRRQTIHPDQAYLFVFLVLLVAQRIHPGYAAGNRPIHLQRSHVHTFQQVQKQEGVKLVARSVF